MTTYYVAGPMSGDPDYPRKFRTAAADLRDQGYDVISPVELDEADGEKPKQVTPGGPEWCAFLARDLQIIAKPEVDGIVVLPGWEESRGARLEVHVACELGKPVLEYPSLKPAASDSPTAATTGQVRTGQVRTFSTGATRDTDEGKPDFEGYLSPRALRAYGRYMLRHSIQSDGSRRPSDNWQKGIPLDAYMKSAFRHFLDWWSLHRGEPVAAGVDLEEACCALIFNVSGYLHESLARQTDDDERGGRLDVYN